MEQQTKERCSCINSVCVCVLYSSSPHPLVSMPTPLSALSAASGRGRMEVCAFLMEHGPNLETANRRGMVPLLSAAKHGHTQVLAFPSSLLLCPHSRRNISSYLLRNIVCVLFCFFYYKDT